MKTRIILFTFFLMIGCIVHAQESERNSIPLIGSTAPSFKAETTNGVLEFPGEAGYYWKIFFSHPMDFTPVCTSEIMQLARMQDEFESLAVKIAVISADTKERHELWKKSIEDALYNEVQPIKINFPLIADPDLKISKLYGMVHDRLSTTKTVRAVFIINPQNVIQAILYYPMNIGRNMDEIIRTVQAMQTAQASQLCTPADWNPGDDLIVPHFPYTEEELIKNPKILNDYRNVGSFVWYRKRLIP
jgi:peroxiredoxin 2/4